MSPSSSAVPSSSSLAKQPTYYDFINTNTNTNATNNNTDRTSSPAAASSATRKSTNRDKNASSGAAGAADYKYMKQRSDQSIRNVSRNLKMIISNNGTVAPDDPEDPGDHASNHDTNHSEGSTGRDSGDRRSRNAENQAVAKIRQVHRNERILKYQLGNLTGTEFRAFHKKLVAFDGFLRAHFDISSNEVARRDINDNDGHNGISERLSSLGSQKGNGSRSQPTESKDLVKAIKRNDTINQKISQIQFFAERIDQKIRILEITKKTLENNKRL